MAPFCLVFRGAFAPLSTHTRASLKILGQVYQTVRLVLVRDMAKEI